VADEGSDSYGYSPLSRLSSIDLPDSPPPYAVEDPMLHSRDRHEETRQGLRSSRRPRAESMVPGMVQVGENNSLYWRRGLVNGRYEEEKSWLSGDMDMREGESAGWSWSNAYLGTRGRATESTLGSERSWSNVHLSTHVQAPESTRSSEHSCGRATETMENGERSWSNAYLSNQPHHGAVPYRPSADDYYAADVNRMLSV
jgi:hypothetical protein